MRLTDLFQRLRCSLALCFLVLGCALSGVSCGYYHMGSMMHPQIKTIAISTIRNDTREPLLTELARTQIAARFQSDNSLKLVSKEEADCILYVRLVDVTTSVSRYNPGYEEDEYRPAEFHLTINAEMEVLIPGRSEPLIRKRTVTGIANYQYNVDPQVGKYYGMRLASFDLGGEIVQYTTEAW
ncbi:MAG: hypothetical protein IKQ82_09175 [Lentisphaeria bacterium]|nr:hypothetical protein [Lentisphaeria bacterium]